MTSRDVTAILLRPPGGLRFGPTCLFQSFFSSRSGTQDPPESVSIVPALCTFGVLQLRLPSSAFGLPVSSDLPDLPCVLLYSNQVQSVRLPNNLPGCRSRTYFLVPFHSLGSGLCDLFHCLGELTLHRVLFDHGAVCCLGLSSLLPAATWRSTAAFPEPPHRGNSS